MEQLYVKGSVSELKSHICEILKKELNKNPLELGLYFKNTEIYNFLKELGMDKEPVYDYTG